MVLKTPSGRKPISQIALRPRLAKALRHISKLEGRILSDVFVEMLDLWLEQRPGEYADIRQELQAYRKRGK